MVIALFVGVTWLVLSHPPDPVYKGKLLSVWVQEYDPGVPSGSGLFVDPAARPEADEAVRHIGTNAIPMLLTMLQARDSYLKFKLISLAQKYNLIEFNHVTAQHLNFGAQEAFQKLGASASNAVPKLIKLYGQNNSYVAQIAIVQSLGVIGPAASGAVPLLLRAAATNTYDPAEWLVSASLWSLGSIHAQPEVVVPALIKLLHDSRLGARVYSAHVLGAYGTNARLGTADLLEIMKDSDWRVRHAALHTLCRIYAKPEWDPDPYPESDPVYLFQPKIDYKSSTLAGVINGLGPMGTNVTPAIPALVKFLDDPDKEVRISATNALQSIAPDSAGKAGVK